MFYKTKFPPVFCSKLQDKVRVPLLRNTKCNMCQPRTHSLFSAFWVYFSEPFFGKMLLFQKKHSFLAKLLLFLHCTWICSHNAALADSPKFHDFWQQNLNNESKKHIFPVPQNYSKRIWFNLHTLEHLRSLWDDSQLCEQQLTYNLSRWNRSIGYKSEHITYRYLSFMNRIYINTKWKSSGLIWTYYKHRKGTTVELKS